MFKKNNKIFVLLLIILTAPFFVEAASVDDLKQDLENQIRQKEQEIGQYQSSINQNKQKAKSLQSDISILEDQISQIRVEISQVDLMIQKSTLNIQGVDSQIDDLENKVNQKKDLLGEYLRTMAQYDQESLLEVILKNNKFSDFFDELNSLETVQEQIQSILVAVRVLKDELRGQKDELEGQRDVQNRLKTVQLSQKRGVEVKQWQKEDLLDKTKGEEYLYRQMIQDNHEEIDYIKDQLTLLDKYNITLDDAVQNAIYAGTKTGIRPAYLLGVLENESRLGLNVGTGDWQNDMYLCNINRGYITMGNSLKNAFLQICEELGLNPDLQPVSAKPTAYKGCGGAMGIAQFMSTTWLSYKDRVAAITGNNPPNPWNFKDAFTASAIKLADAGATARTYEAERKAYAMYVGGKYWRGLLSVAERAMVYADQFQKEYFD